MALLDRIFKKTEDGKKIEGYSPRMYLQMKIVYVLLSILNIIVVLVSFYKLGWAMYNAQLSFGAIARADEKLLQSNTAVMVMLSDTEQMPAQIEKLEGLFREMDEAVVDFNAIGSVDEGVKERFDQSMEAVGKYRTGLQLCQQQYETAVGDAEKLENFETNILALYHSDVEPLMNEATKLMSETMDYQKESAIETFFEKARSVLIVLALLILILAVGVIAITMMDRAAKRAAIELQKRAQEIEETSKKLFQSRNKTKAIAFTNVLTGLKNRYALEEDLGSRLESESFNIANFDFDGFRNFNEVYGRDFGDEFLSTIAEQLKAQFSEIAEIYNITSDEFTFVFQPSVTGNQVMGMAQRIAEVMSASYTVYNVTVQLTVSGCAYRYAAGECLSLNSLLSKMDGVMHTVKNNGGNAVLEVNRI